MNKKGFLPGFFFVFLIGFGFASALRAVPPGPGGEWPDKPVCLLNKTEIQKRAVAFKAAKARGSAFAAPTVSGTKKVLVIRVDFSDEPMTNTLPQAETLFLRLRNYYIENSFGVFTPTFTVTNGVTGPLGNNTAYRLPDTLAEYGVGTPGTVGAIQKLFSDAVAVSTSDYNASFDDIMVYHAGFGEETSGNPSDLWSLFIPGLSPSILGGKSFDSFTIVPENEVGLSALGVTAHEFGHQALGLPDLYDTSVSGGESTVGMYDLMDYPYSTADAGTPHLGAWSKYFAGFSSPQSVKGTVALSPAETSSTAFNLIPTANSNEYFLTEFRSTYTVSAIFDKRISGVDGLPMSGLALWHVDDNVIARFLSTGENIVNAPSANGQGHPGVDLVEADGTPADPGLDLGLGNLFVNGQNVTPSFTGLFDGSQSGFTVANIAVTSSPDLLTSEMVFFQASPSLVFNKVVNFPNPAGDTGKYPPRPGSAAGTLTTFVAHLSKPVNASNISLNIYTLGAELVRSAPSSEIRLKAGTGQPTADYKWVYEYDWDGKNDGGKKVTPGVYIYRFKSGKETKDGKLMLLR